MHSYTKFLALIAIIFTCYVSDVLSHPTERGVTPVRPFAGPARTYAYTSAGVKLGSGPITDVADVKAVQPLFDNGIVLKGFATAAAVTAVTCAAPQPPPVCIAGAITGVFTVFFSIFKASSGKREFPHALITDFPPLIGCGTVCRLENETPEGDWRQIGNVTVGGVFHSIHYSRNGGVSGIRAIKHGVVSGKRSDVKNNRGVVADYMWRNDNKKAYDSFHSTSSMISGFASDAVNSLFGDNDILSCADFTDSDGILAPGLLSIGWNNQEFEFQDGESAALLGECTNI